MPDTYDMMLKEHYYCDIRYDENGVKKTILKGSDEIPTFEQFRYWYFKKYDCESRIRSSKGDRYFELNKRPILGSSTAEAFGPGFKYQMDATVGDIYLVSRFNRSWIVGRPVIYVIIDVFSRMIVGLHISLRGPSWDEASIAIANAILNKKSYCAKYGIDISDEEWPAYGIMSVLFGDRGELAGTMIEPAANALNFRIENAPPYRADWKGIVERYFKTIHEKVEPFMPGSIKPDFAVRGGHDYRLDAKLDIYQFTRLIIKCVLKYNNYHFMKYYPVSKEMIAEDIDPIPCELWKWGLKNSAGFQLGMMTM
ncbi:Integrase core domain-containing protein [Sporomusa acidovorans]|nr:transposon Tn7 transposition protein TnsB [Sporomusa acidovorans DSM 3132]SDD69793.1 Integrase core domain-containing protein [Sporomusa acidovorans]